MKIQEIKNTLGPHQRETLVLRKGDVGGTVHFTVPDLTGITSADFRLIKPDGTFVVKSGAIVQNTVIVQITEQMCTVYGSGIYNLELKASGVSVYTAIGRCLIDKNIDLNDYAASVAEVNGLVFPDDFLTSADLSDYVTETELEDAIAAIPTYTLPNYSLAPHKTGRKWLDNKDIWEVTIAVTFTSNYKEIDLTSLDIDFIIPKIEGGVYDSDGGFVPIYYENSVSIYMSDTVTMKITNNFWNNRPSGYVTIFYTKEVTP